MQDGRYSHALNVIKFTKEFCEEKSDYKEEIFNRNLYENKMTDMYNEG